MKFSLFYSDILFFIWDSFPFLSSYEASIPMSQIHKNVFKMYEKCEMLNTKSNEPVREKGITNERMNLNNFRRLY